MVFSVGIHQDLVPYSKWITYRWPEWMHKWHTIVIYCLLNYFVFLLLAAWSWADERHCSHGQLSFDWHLGSGWSTFPWMGNSWENCLHHFSWGKITRFKTLVQNVVWLLSWLIIWLSFRLNFGWSSLFELQLIEYEVVEALLMQNLVIKKPNLKIHSRHCMTLVILNNIVLDDVIFSSNK